MAQQNGNAMIHSWRFVVISLFSLGLLAGCLVKESELNNGGPTTGANPGSSGGSATKEVAAGELVSALGSSTVYLISQAMAEEFEKTTPHKVRVGGGGTGGGYQKFLARQCDLWNASRPVADKEVAELKEKGIEILELSIAIDGLSIAVHPENDWCPGLTIADLKRLWEPDSKIQKWSDLNPQWPDQAIALFGADTDSGTFEYFTEVVVGKKKSSRTDYTPAADDNVLVGGVAGNKYSLGYIPFGYCIENKDKVKVIGVSPTKDSSETAAPFVVPTFENILSGEYAPLSRPLFVYANREGLKRPEVAAFLKFLIADKSQPLISSRGFVRLKDEDRQMMKSRLNEAIGSAFGSE